MTIENLQELLDQKEKLIARLTEQNEHLYQQYNHVIVRNNKFLQRIDQLQQTINDLHLRIQELQLLNQNQYDLTQKLRTAQNQTHSVAAQTDAKAQVAPAQTTYTGKVDLDSLYQRWKNYPGQEGRNTPNLRKQMQMLIHLYENESLPAAELFSMTGINHVTGARYISYLKKFDLLRYVGARKKGQYFITETGRGLIENKLSIAYSSESSAPSAQKPAAEVDETTSELQILHRERKQEFRQSDEEFKSVESPETIPHHTTDPEHFDF